MENKIVHVQNRILWMEIERVEGLRLDYYVITVRMIADAMKGGKSSSSVFVDFSVMKERYLEALCMYRHFGLTSLELYQKRRIWLWRPGESDGSTRVKTVSMFLSRLRRAGLADRKREGHEYRYFVTMNGIKRLLYYWSLSKTKDELFRTYQEQQRAALIRDLKD